MKYLGCVFLFNLFLLSCTSPKKIVFNYLDSYEIQPNLKFQETKIGGISGVDYQSSRGIYYLVSDDRSENNPARFYIANINISNDVIDSVCFVKPVICLGINNKLLEQQASDFESIRYNPIQNELFLGDEGGRKGFAGIQIIDTAGNYLSRFKLDSVYLKKVRFNKSFESISFSRDFKSFFYATEAPLVDDGDEPSIDNGGLIRIIESNLDGIMKKEYLYYLEKVPFRATKMPPWQGTGSDNGLSEILSFGKDQFLTLERSGAYQDDGTFRFTCKVFWVKAKSKKSINNLKIFETTKQEVVDFSKLSNGMFNIEGMTLGPIINKKQSVVFVSDNNFKEKIPTMIYVFTMTYK